MAKDPAFLFYTGDFTTGTQFFTDAQVGVYIRLLMAQHQHGRLTEKQVLMISKTLDKEVMQKFTIDSNGLFYNQRLESEIEKRKSFSESRRGNRLGKTKQVNNTSFSSDLHMEDKDENENKDLLNKSISDFLSRPQAKELDPDFYQFVERYTKMLCREFPDDHDKIIEIDLSAISKPARAIIKFASFEEIAFVLTKALNDEFWKTKLFNLETIKKNWLQIKNDKHERSKA